MDESTSSSKSRHRDKEHKSKRKHKDGSEDRKYKRKRSEKLKVVDDDLDDEDMWVEKNIDMDGERLLATNIPTAKSLALTSSALAGVNDPALPKNRVAESSMKRDAWMMEPTSAPDVLVRPTRLAGDESMTEDYGESSGSPRTASGAVDFFATLGTERKPKPSKPDPEKPAVHRMEINPDVRAGRAMDHDAPLPVEKPVTPGGPGSQWRMMRLRRVYETAEEEGTSIGQLALERFGSMQAFEAAKDERRILDEREGRRTGGSGGGRGKDRDQEGTRGFMFTETPRSGASSRSSSFRRPGEGTAPTTPSPATGPPAAMKRLDSLRLQSGTGSPLAQSHTPIPTVMTPQQQRSTTATLSPSALNKLQAQALRAKLMGAPNADTLQRQFDEASKAARSAPAVKVEVLPTLDGRGRMYDVGHGKEDEDKMPGNRRKKEEKFQSHDPKTGEVLRINADDDTTTLGEMLRQEKMGAGMSDQKDLDAQFAQAIMGDGKFTNDLDYIDDNAEKLSRQKMRTDAMKRQFAVHDYKRTQKAMESCSFCFGEDDSPPKAPVVAMGTRVYLACTTYQELVEGHCLIVPIQHHLNMLEGDDDVWDETRNFMKCLMQMFAAEDKGIVFYETVITMKKQKHSFIECVPMPWNEFEDIPGYFKESIMSSEAEWSQHKKLIDFSSRPGGFRRAMVPNLPYFMVQFDHKGERGYGHVIEGTGAGAGDAEEEGGMDEGEKGGGEFPKYFAAEIIGNVLEIEARKWRRPKKVDTHNNKQRVAAFKQKYDKFDWTGMIGR